MNFVSAMASGYGAFHLFASLFNDDHRNNWHLTATAGVFGSTMAISKLLDFSPSDISRAIKFAAVATSGGSNVAHARNGATRFTRAQAALLGIFSAFESRAGSPGPENLFFGPGGLDSRFSIKTEFPDVNINDGLMATSLRYFPWSGFMHQALLNLSLKLPPKTVTIKSVQIHLPKNLYSLIGSQDYGPWWSIKTAITSTLLNGSPMTPYNPDIPTASFSTMVDEWANAFGQVKIETSTIDYVINFELPADSNPSDLDDKYLELKWSDLAGTKKNQIYDLTSEMLSGDKSTKFHELFNSIFYKREIS
jgi:hypothetical protein